MITSIDGSMTAPQNLCPCPYVWPPDLQRVFAVVIKLRILRWDQPDECPHKRQKRRRQGPRTRKRLKRCSTSQRTSGTTRSWKRKGSLLPQSLQKKRGPADTLISDFRPPEGWETSWWLFYHQVNRFVIICYSMLRKLGQLLSNKLIVKVIFQRENKFQTSTVL